MIGNMANNRKQGIDEMELLRLKQSLQQRREDSLRRARVENAAAQEVATNSPVITPYEVEDLGNSEYQLKIYFNTSRLTLEANTYKAIVIGGGVKESLVEE